MSERDEQRVDATDDVPVRTVSPPPPIGETVDAPVMDGAEELQAEAAEAIESGEVDLSDPRHCGPSVVDEETGPGRAKPR